MSRLIQATSYLILAMRERWLNLILDGKKTAEVRPKPRKNKNRLSRRSAAKTDKSQPTCLHCRYWSMWDHSCATRAAALDDFSPVHPDTPACKEFQPE